MQFLYIIVRPILTTLLKRYGQSYYTHKAETVLTIKNNSSMWQKTKDVGFTGLIKSYHNIKTNMFKHKKERDLQQKQNQLNFSMWMWKSSLSISHERKNRNQQQQKHIALFTSQHMPEHTVNFIWKAITFDVMF